MRHKTRLLLKVTWLVCLSVLSVQLFPQIARGERAQETERTLSDAPGKELLMNKCFQCHNDGMWKDLRLERKGWEGVLYRMVGRGALWTEDEINRMAAYLTTAFGPKTAKTPP
ncbi:MAG: cytochrome c [Acidobacteria bacterium]|nr:cytochrome c [Acidobacteriota bacterium]